MIGTACPPKCCIRPLTAGVEWSLWRWAAIEQQQTCLRKEELPSVRSSKGS